MALTERFVERVTEPGRYFDKSGLYLRVRSATNKSWLLRYNRNGNGEKWMGLGSARNWNLAAARERAQAARQLLDDGTDPIEARRAERDARRKEAEENITFKQATEEFLELYESEWRNSKHRKQWRTTLKDYASSLADRPVKAIDAAVINTALAPTWRKVPATAARVKNRIERVLEWVRTGKPLPAPKASRTRHHPAMDFRDVPAFAAELRASEGTSVRALEFLILTAARTGEVVNARWSEIDMEQKLWTISASRMKSNRPHRVPLSDRAVEILEGLPREAGNPFVFAGSQKGKPIANSQMLKLLRAMRPGCVVHGFRSSFSTWARENTSFPSDIIEASLAHKNPNKTEAAYARGDLLEKRRRLMSDWSRYCSTVPAEAGAAVIPLRRS